MKKKQKRLKKQKKIKMRKFVKNVKDIVAQPEVMEALRLATAYVKASIAKEAEAIEDIKNGQKEQSTPL